MAQPPPVTAPTDPQAVKNRVNSALQDLRILIDTLPESVPLGEEDGPIVKYFTGDDLNEFAQEESPYAALDRAWVRTFQRPAEELPALVCRGPYGLEIVHNTVTWLVNLPAMEENNGYFLAAERLNWLNNLIAKTYALRFRVCFDVLTAESHVLRTPTRIVELLHRHGVDSIPPVPTCDAEPSGAAPSEPLTANLAGQSYVKTLAAQAAKLIMRPKRGYGKNEVSN